MPNGSSDDPVAAKPTERLDLAAFRVSGGEMLAHTRAMIASSAYAFIIGGKVAGIYDHAAGRHLRIAAEAQGEQLQGFDGDRSARFGGTLPEIYDANAEAFVSIELEGATARGYDRGSSTAYSAQVTERLVQLYDHRAGTWFSYGVQVA